MSVSCLNSLHSSLNFSLHTKPTTYFILPWILWTEDSVHQQSNFPQETIPRTCPTLQCSYSIFAQQYTIFFWRVWLAGTSAACLQVWNRPQVLPFSRIITANCILPSLTLSSYVHSPRQGLIDSRRKLSLGYKEIWVEILKHHWDAKILIQANNNGGQREASAQELHGFEGIRYLKGED